MIKDKIIKSLRLKTILKISIVIIVFFFFGFFSKGEANAWASLQIVNPNVYIGDAVYFWASADVGCGQSCGCNSNTFLQINWGDGVQEVVRSSGHSHSYSRAGTYNVQVIASRTCNSGWICQNSNVESHGSNVVTVTVRERFSAPTVDIKANGSNGPITIGYNQTATLSWTSTNANACIFKGFYMPTSGLQSTGNLTSSQNFLMTCTGPGGTASDYVTVNVSSPPLVTPTVSLKSVSDQCTGANLNASFKWSTNTPSSSIKLFEIWAIDNKGVAVPVKTGINPNWRETSLILPTSFHGKTFTWYVRALTNNWLFYWSNPYSFTNKTCTVAQPPPKPTPSLAQTCRRDAGIGYADATLTWTGSAGWFSVIAMFSNGKSEIKDFLESYIKSYTFNNVPQGVTGKYYVIAWTRDKKKVTYSDPIVAQSKYCNNVVQGKIVSDEAGDGPGAGDSALTNITGFSASANGLSGIYTPSTGTYKIGGLPDGNQSVAAVLSSTSGYVFTGYLLLPNELYKSQGTPSTMNAAFSLSGNTTKNLYFGVKNNNPPAIFNVLMVANSIQINRDNLNINYDSNAVNNPPPGFKELLTPIWEETNP